MIVTTMPPSSRRSRMAAATVASSKISYPGGDPAVGPQDDRAALVAARDDLEEAAGCLGRQRQVAELVANHGQPLEEARVGEVVALCFFERWRELLGGCLQAQVGEVRVQLLVDAARSPSCIRLTETAHCSEHADVVARCHEHAR